MIQTDLGEQGGVATNGAEVSQMELLVKFYQTWVRAECTRGCYSCCEEHDCRCPKAFGREGLCNCERDELNRLENLILASGIHDRISKRDDVQEAM